MTDKVIPTSSETLFAFCEWLQADERVHKLGGGHVINGFAQQFAKANGLPPINQDHKAHFILPEYKETKLCEQRKH